jgi:Zn-dependent protease with chaperone function
MIANFSMCIYRIRRSLIWILLSGFICIGVIANVSQAKSPDSSNYANLNITLEKQGNAEVNFSLYPAPVDANTFAQNFRKALDCPDLKQEIIGEDESEEVSDNKPSSQKLLSLSGNCDRLLSKEGFLVQGELKITPLIKLLKPLDVKNLDILLTLPKAPYIQVTEDIPPTGNSDRVPEFFQGIIPKFHRYQIKTDAKDFPPIQVGYGYRYLDVAIIFTPILVIFVIPLGLVVWLRKMALQSADRDLTAAWYGYTRTFSWVITGTWLIWLSTISTVNPSEFIDFIFQNDISQSNPFARLKNFGLSNEILKLGIYFLIPMIVTTIAEALSYPVYQKLRNTEWTKAEMIWQSVITQASAFLPLTLFLLGLNAMIHIQFQLGITLMAIGFIASIGLGLASAKAQNFTLNALTTGELRDRTFEMAQKAGVKLMQVYVIPAGKGQMVNAFATSQNTIMLSDDLLKKFNKSEVDAIVAHELGHLKHEHPKRLTRWGIFIFGAAIVLNSLVLKQFVPKIASVISSPLFLALLVSVCIFYLSRQYELVADFEAVTISGNAEATIRALTKITHLNLMPMDWGKWQEKFFTHPSTNNRVKAIARQVNMPKEHLQEILKLETSLDYSTQEFYQLPEIINDSDPIFSSSFKSHTTLLVFLASITTTILIPIAIALLAKAYRLQGLVFWFIYGIGFLLVPLCQLWIQSQINSSEYAKLKRKLTQRFQSHGIDCSSEFISLAPDAQISTYEGFTDWDIGFLAIAPHSITYHGEQTQFQLQASDITEMYLDRKGADWWKIPRIVINWQHRESKEYISIWANGRDSFLKSKNETIKLFQKLQSWQENSEIDAQIVSLPPAIAEVTSTPITDIPKFQILGSTLSIYLPVAIVCGLAHGLTPSELIYTLAVLIFNAIAQWLPFWQYQDSKE